MTETDLIDLERRYEDLRTQVERLKMCVERIKTESNYISEDCANIDYALSETQKLLEKISVK